MNKSFTRFALFVGGLLLWAAAARAQTATVTGRVINALTEEPVELVVVYIDGTTTATETATNGRYSLQVPADEAFTLVFSRLGYKEGRQAFRPIPMRNSKQVDVELVPRDSELEVVVRESRIEEAGMIKEDVEAFKLLPTTTGNLESLLPHIALGVSPGTGGELSSQYNVRGGNFDENLVYVNDFEIYRPQLIRSGQQEGLTFANPDLISSLSFSSGGFEAKYGDKMSSVLDIKYKLPDTLKGSVGLSFLGANAHIEGSVPIGKSDYRRLRFLGGVRYKTTRYLLGSLDITGEYIPNFTDLQGYITYDISRDWQLGLIGNYNRSDYRFRPNERSTAFGLINFSLELFSVFDGQERNDFTTSMGGVSLTYLPDRTRNPLFLKFLASTYQSLENERIDILGDYSLRQIDSDLGSNTFGEVLAELGTGTQQLYARNFLVINVTNAQHKGGIELQVADRPNLVASHFLQWSVKWQHERIDDMLSEWERLDSAGYSLGPDGFDPSLVEVFSLLQSENQIQSNRFSAFLQETYSWRRSGVGEIKLSGGLRATWWDFNRELVVSPRAQILYKPLRWKADMSFRLAAGLYQQPPFYRELRRLDGTINRDIRAQKSFHLVGGLTWDFYLGNNPKKFRFITEAYYKKLWDLISYDIENVRIRYSGENDATGYIMGIDFRLNGEFVPNAESWISLSILTAREALNDVQHLERERGEEEGVPVRTVPRPTDRRVSLAVYFQDYFPGNENFRMNLNLVVGTGLPFGIPNDNRVYRNTYRLRPYYRVDLGFAAALFKPAFLEKHPRHVLRFTRGAWISLEVFNLLQVQNQSGNTWIKTIFQQQYAIPNNLTSRRINLRLRVDW